MVACSSWFLLSSVGELAHQTGLDGRTLEVMCCRDTPLVPPGGRGCLVQGFTPGVDHTRSVGGRGHVLQGLSVVHSSGRGYLVQGFTTDGRSRW